MAFITTALSVVVVAVFVSTVSCGTCTPVHIPLPMGSVTADNMDPEYQHGDIFYQNCTDTPISTMRKTVGWCQDFHATSSRIQINLPHTMAVNAIVFQTHQAYCPKTLDYSSTAYMGTFDLQYVVPGDSQGLLVTYDQDLPALDGTTSEKKLEFTQPLVTQTLQIIPKFANQYPCFRFMLLGCEAESMCKKDLCLNGGKCSGNNFCTCAVGFFGERCNQTVEELVQEDYSFTEIKNGLLDSPDASFKVFGDVTLVPSSDRRRDHHHGHHGHSCHFGGHHGHHGHCEHHEHHHHDDHHHHDHHHGHDCNCHAMHNLHEHHHGFTTSLNVHFGHDHHHDSHCHLFSNGGNVAGPHSGASLHYHQGHLHFQVKTDQHHWHVSHPCNLLTATVHNIACSWHPHTGVSLILNNKPVASSNQAKPLPTATPTPAPTTTTTTTTAAPTTKTPTTAAPVTSAPAGPAPAAVTVTSLPLRICNGHTTVSVNVQLTINVTIGALNMFPVPQNTLCNLNRHGPYLPPPPTIAPPPTTTTQSTTTVPVTATSTHAPTTSTAAPTTTTDPHRPVCYNYANQASIVASTAKTRCKYGEVCALFKDQNGFTAKCLTEALCKSGQNLAGSNCFECCKTYLCNDNCSAPKANTCADQSSCAVLMSTGFDVCSDQQKAVDICPKTCNICSSGP